MSKIRDILADLETGGGFSMDFFFQSLLGLTAIHFVLYLLISTCKSEAEVGVIYHTYMYCFDEMMEERERRQYTLDGRWIADNA